MSGIDVSVIIACYNVAPYITRAVNSALTQEGVTVEVIVVDDRSSDDSWNIVQSIADPRLVPIQSTVNGGPGAARNIALAKARGEFIAILDGDDHFLPGRLQRMITQARAAKADIVIDNLLVEREADGTKFPMFPDFSSAPLTVEEFISGNACFTSGYTLGYLKPVIATSFLRAHHLRYPEAIPIGEDYLFLLEALAHGAVSMRDPSAGYAYTARAGSTSHRLKPSDVECMIAQDQAFFTRHALSRKAQMLQRKRERNLRETLAYTQLVDAVKARNLSVFYRVALAEPLALRYLWLPVQARFNRLFKRF